ncbi:MAG: 1-acyl-sn-glycerol-3-phosphate acyltransferase [Alphaproteobacteria bacterium]|nr:1-acyl-sn-glycerol-3-phosphate acyltransferase [Alphaproteobacteria bacterium]
MIFLRSLLFNILFYTWTILFFPELIILLVFPKKYLHQYARFWSRGVIFLMKRVIGIQIQIKGQIPQKKALFAIQHQSALETLVFHFFVPNTVFVLKRELFWLPVFGLALMKMGHIGINRKMGKNAILKIRRLSKKRFEEGYNLAIFPEGTRMPVGKVGHIGSGVAIMSETLMQPVIPVSLNTGEFWKRNAFIKTSGKTTLSFEKEIPISSRANLFDQIKKSFE